MTQQYKVSGLAVVEAESGGVIYDLLESKRETRIIHNILNEGYGPDWDDIEPIFDERMRKAERKAGS